MRVKNRVKGASDVIKENMVWNLKIQAAEPGTVNDDGEVDTVDPLKAKIDAVLGSVTQKEEAHFIKARQISDAQRLMVTKVLVLQAGNSSSWLGTETNDIISNSKSMLDSKSPFVSVQKNSTAYGWAIDPNKASRDSLAQSERMHPGKSRSSVVVNSVGLIKVQESFTSQFGTFSRRDALQDAAFTTVAAMMDAKHSLMISMSRDKEGWSLVHTVEPELVDVYSREVPWSNCPQYRSRDFLDRISAEQMFPLLLYRTLRDNEGGWKQESSKAMQEMLGRF